jgi:hypothetical protein
MRAARRRILVAGHHDVSTGDPRPTVSAIFGPSWGYQVDDVNLALGDLVTDVGHEEAVYR